MLPEATAAPLFLSFLSVLSTDRLTTSQARCAAAVFMIFALCSNSPFSSLRPFANDRPFTSPTRTVFASPASPAFVNANRLSFTIASRDSLASTPTHRHLRLSRFHPSCAFSITRELGLLLSSSSRTPLDSLARSLRPCSPNFLFQN